MMPRLLPIVLLTLVAGCAQDDMADLRQFMQEAGKDSTEKLDPLPTLKTSESFAYDATEIPDPFKARNLRAAKGGGQQPDLDRPKEPLELFPLDGLHMVGTLSRGSELYALVRTSDNSLYRVKKGDRIGLNFGTILSISDTALEIKETVQDSAGDWTESRSTLHLQE